MKRMRDAVAVGEMLIDFTPMKNSGSDKPVYEANPGGAPANVLAAMSKFGLKTALIAKVGDDFFGQFLTQYLIDYNIDPAGVVKSTSPTTLAFVNLADNGERSFGFYRKGNADESLSIEEIPTSLIESARLVHFGSVSLTASPASDATFHVVKTARELGKVVSYDPNLRPLLWDSLDQAKEMILNGFEFSDIVKVSEEELEFLTGTKDIEQGSAILVAKYNTPLLFVTLGAEGCVVRKGQQTAHVPSFKVNAIDTTGAGDSFFGAILAQVLQSGKSVAELSFDELLPIVRYANAMAALTTMNRGGMPAIPDVAAVNAFVK
jgi:sugar/nucleoside kinase (ribokinase family)